MLSNMMTTESRAELNIIFETSNKLKRVYLLVIELKHPIFGFEQTHLEL